MAAQDPRLGRHLRPTAIQAFEFTYEFCFKMLNRYLRLASANPEEIDELVFNDVIREARRQSLLKSELDEWMEFRRQHVTAIHTYNEEKAREVFESFPGFLDEARSLSNRLHDRPKALN